MGVVLLAIIIALVVVGGFVLTVVVSVSIMRSEQVGTIAKTIRVRRCDRPPATIRLIS
jgi:hypothetical protein